MCNEQARIVAEVRWIAVVMMINIAQIMIVTHSCGVKGDGKFRYTH